MLRVACVLKLTVNNDVWSVSKVSGLVMCVLCSESGDLLYIFEDLLDIGFV